MVTSEELLEHLRGRLPAFTPGGAPQPLQGGYLNYVWRVPGHPSSVIVKVAPPYIASQPGVPLDAFRTVIEARSLAAFGEQGALASVASALVRPPRLLDFDEAHHILVMEDVCTCPGLGEWLRDQTPDEAAASRVGRLIGEFIGALHGASHRVACLAETFTNQGIQETRLRVQYSAIGELALRAGLREADTIGRIALALGRQLQQPGVCVIMGDLWPPSILIAEEGVRIIDWELAHYGHPPQDVAHLVAHLWMHAHRAPTQATARAAHAVADAFLGAYRQALGVQFAGVLGPDGVRQCAVHLGAEVLVRTVGAFQQGYLYEGLSPDDPVVQEAVEVAATHIQTPDRTDTFATLRD